MSTASAAPARAGRSGKAFTIATKSDAKYVDAIERLIGQKIEWHDGDLSTVVASEGDDEGRAAAAARAARSAASVAAGASGGEKRGRGERHAKPRVEAAAAEIAEQPSLVPASVIDARRERKQAIKSDNSEREAKPEGGATQPNSRAATNAPRATVTSGRAATATSARTAPSRTAASASRTTTARSASATTCRPS